MSQLTKISAILLTSLTLAGAAQAATVGGYVGGALGTSTLRTNNPTSYPAGAVLKSSHTTGGLGGKIFGGYNFNKNFGMEAAYAQYATSTYKTTFSDNSTLKKTFDLNAVSLVGKAYLPLGNDKFNVYGLAGLALVNGKQYVKGTPVSYHKSQTVRRIRPTFGIGASYDITPKLTANVELSRIQGTGNTKTTLSNTNKAIPNADMLSAGLAYNFG